MPSSRGINPKKRLIIREIVKRFFGFGRGNTEGCFELR